MKRCPSCDETKPASDFGQNRSLRDGLSFYCLACNRERSNQWYRDHRRALGHEVRDLSCIPEGFRWCPACRQAVAHEDYTRNAGTASGFGSRCRACDRATNSAGYFYRKYTLTQRELSALRDAQQDRCGICGEPAPQHLDHDHATGGSAGCCVRDAIRDWACSVMTPTCSGSRRCTSRVIGNSRLSWRCKRRPRARTGPTIPAARR